MGYLAMALVSATPTSAFGPKRTNSMIPSSAHDPKQTFPTEIAQAGKKRPKADLRSFVELGTSKSIRHPGLSSGLLDRLVGITRQIDIHLTELRHLGNVGVKSLLGVLRLDLERLLE